MTDLHRARLRRIDLQAKHDQAVVGLQNAREYEAYLAALLADAIEAEARAVTRSTEGATY